ncbi:aminopeptidase P family protein [Phototrophicus methaneseepsis]|uniref:Aminopeptidase P family protein n=1 Tax=Phototrophicus methaneseepsis TaxID=2710758 RepID=A0A7S8EC50_9CHLR|nr:Xaa-Pro peptidase family protein [Phototrophicus methaneseepsis]QPC84261.1 aminopeptidase P family protein [Phototrophicus methaneseepsis]
MLDYKARMTQFQQDLEGQADLAFFPISADLNYLTGVPRDIPNYGWTMHPGGWLEGGWIAPNKPPVLTLPRMTAEFGGLIGSSDVELLVLGDHGDPAEMVAKILKQMDLPESPTIAVGDRTHGETLIHLQEMLPGVKFVSGTTITRKRRVIKSEEEIDILRKAGAITEAAFADTIKNLKHGMTELEVMTEVNYQLRKHGSLGESFTTSLYNSGVNHPLVLGKRLETMPRVLEPPVAILFDFGAILDDYCYDFGRTVWFGEPNDEIIKVHGLVMAAQAAGMAALKVGNTTAEADAAARSVIEEAGMGPLFRHRLGHGIGMDVHEPPFLTASDHTPLQAGMLFTDEPSILQDAGPSARVEDIVVVREGKGEPLTSGFQELVVID